MAKSSSKKRDQVFLNALSLSAPDWPLIREWIDVLEKTSQGQAIKSLTITSHPQILKGLLASDIVNVHEAKVNWLTVDGKESFLLQALHEPHLKDITSPAGIPLEKGKTKMLIVLGRLLHSKAVSPFDTVQVHSKEFPNPSLLSAAILIDSFAAPLLAIEGLKALKQDRAVEAARAYFGCRTHGVKPGYERLSSPEHTMDFMPHVFNKIDLGAIKDPKELAETLMALFDFKNDLFTSFDPNIYAFNRDPARHTEFLLQSEQKFTQLVKPVLDTFANIPASMFDDRFPSDLAFFMGATPRSEHIARLLGEDARQAFSKMLQDKMNDNSKVSFTRHRQYNAEQLVMSYPIHNTNFKMDQATSLAWIDRVQSMLLRHSTARNPNAMLNTHDFANLIEKDSFEALSDDVRDYFVPIVKQTRDQSQLVKAKTKEMDDLRRAPFAKKGDGDAQQLELDQLHADLSATLVGSWSSAGFARRLQAPKVKKL